MQAGQFAVHPALLDAALHASLGLLADDETAASTKARRPRARAAARAVASVLLGGGGICTPRVRLACACRISPTGAEAVSILVADERGRRGRLSAVAECRARVSRRQLGWRAWGLPESLFRLDWASVPPPPCAGSFRREWAVLSAEGTSVLPRRSSGAVSTRRCTRIWALERGYGRWRLGPEVVFVDCARPGGEASAGTRAPRRWRRGAWGARAGSGVGPGVARAIERFAASRLVVVTRDAVAAGAPEDMTALAQAPIWGLVRSAQPEHPGRFVLLDLDGAETPWRVLDAALATGEPQLAMREGGVLAPRLARVPAGPRAARQENAGARDDPCREPCCGLAISSGRWPRHIRHRGTVADHRWHGRSWGALLARHLVTRAWGAQPAAGQPPRGEAEGAPELQGELEALGAQVRSRPAT